MKEYLNLLNPKQLEACKDVYGPSLIIAGAGSGKTRVLTTRIAYMIDEHHIDSSNILAITFTNKAAKEMKDRLDVLVGKDSRFVTCKTFHSFCAFVLRNDIDKLDNRKKSFQIIDDDDTEALIKEAMINLKYDPKEDKPKDIANDISLIKAEIKTYFDYDQFKSEMLLKIMNEYNSLLLKNNLLDFDDLLLLTVELFRNNKDVLLKYQEQYKYILVDEFQDSSNIQYDLVDMLGKKYKNIFIVGDEDQSIYSFRGANIGNIRKFMASFPEHHKYVLDENYRSTEKILDCANSLISHNEERIKKDLWTENKGGDDVSLTLYDTDKTEAQNVIKTIKKFVYYENYKYSDFAIIYRNNFLSRNFEDELIYNRIPYRVYSGLSFYKREEVKDMMAYLRLTINPDDFYSFKRCLLRPKRGIGDAALSRIEALLPMCNDSIKEAISLTSLNEKQSLSLTSFMDIIYELNESMEKKTLKEFYKELYEKSSYKSYIDSIDDDDKKKSKTENIQELLSAIAAIETEGSIKETLTDFLETVTLLTELDTESDNEDSVSLITMHSAKGLEYRYVFAVGLEDDVIPGSANDLTEYEEERRILYVCLTRAMSNLSLSFTRSRFKYGNFNSPFPSRFLRELGLRVKTERDSSSVTSKQTFKPAVEQPRNIPKGDIEAGERVYHQIFKEGVVMGQVEGFYIIKFDDGSVKKVVVNHPLLKKV